MLYRTIIWGWIGWAENCAANKTSGWITGWGNPNVKGCQALREASLQPRQKALCRRLQDRHGRISGSERCAARASAMYVCMYIGAIDAHNEGVRGGDVVPATAEGVCIGEMR